MSAAKVPFDVLVVGSGPAGVHAADQFLKNGLTVGLVDIGFSDATYQAKIPDLPFSAIRKSDPDQSFYFLGKDQESVFVDQSRAGAHLTPPRRHMIERSKELFPTVSSDFTALMATSRGGLGASWGANCFSFSAAELERIGLNASKIAPYYDQVAAEIGVSGDSRSDTAPQITNFHPLQPALNPDTNASVILDRYSRKRETFLREGFSLGTSALAALSEPLGDRRPHSYHDMDFWSDHGSSVYRPHFTLQKILSHPRFNYLTNRLAKRFRSTDAGVELVVKQLDSGTTETFSARRVLIAAGALNTGRLVAASLEAYDRPLPLLCNPNHWIAAVNVRMLGKPVADRRHSLSQLTALMKREDPEDFLVGHFYSYRSLLLFRLLKDLPVPPSLGIPLLRLLMTSFTLVNLHYSDFSSPSQTMRLIRDASELDRMKIDFIRDQNRAAADRRELRRFLSFLRRLGIMPLKVMRPQSGASIHYAGTVPSSADFQKLGCDFEGRLWEAPHVFVGDSSSWRFLPSKGLTFTIMANARLVADEITQDLAKGPGK